MSFAHRAIHLDFHTMPCIDALCDGFDGAKFAATLKGSHVELINVFAKCNLGFCYYPTEIGTVYPSLRRDLLGEMVEACHAEGIQVVAYFNLGLDHEAALHRREWCTMSPDGVVYAPQRLGHFFRKMCLNTGYGDYQEALVREVLERYAVDGIFLDCIHNTPCIGLECIDKMEEAGIDHADEGQLADYARRRNVEYAARIRKIVPKSKLLYYNGIPYRDQQHFASHFELECLPSGAWGYEVFPARVRYTRTLGKPVLAMTGRFEENWGEIVGTRPQAALDYDCFNALANAVHCSVGDHLPPEGTLLEAAYRKISKSYDRVKALEPWTRDAKALAEIAVYAPTPERPMHSPSDVPPVQGAARMLGELQAQFDVVDEDGDLGGYRVVILPDKAPMTPTLRRKLEKFFSSGGWIVASNEAGLDTQTGEFPLAGWPVEYRGPEPHNAAFARATGAFARGLEEDLEILRIPGSEVRRRKGAKQLAQLVAPWFDKHWDGRHGYVYIPPKKATGRPAVAWADRVVYFSFPIFETYYRHPHAAFRTMLKNAIEIALPEPILRIQGMPSFGRATVTRQGARTMTHLLCYCPERRGAHDVIEEPIAVRGVELAMRLPKARKASLAPSGKTLEIERQGDYAVVRVPDFDGYQVVAFE